VKAVVSEWNRCEIGSERSVVTCTRMGSLRIAPREFSKFSIEIRAFDYIFS